MAYFEMSGERGEGVMEMGRREAGTARAWAAKPVSCFGLGTDKERR